MRSDKELKKLVNVFIDQDNILNIVFSLTGKTTEEEEVKMAKLAKEHVSSLLKKNFLQKYNTIINLSALTGLSGGNYVPSEARKIYAEISTYNQRNSVAYVGGSLLIRTVVKFILLIAGKEKKMRWFDKKEKARKWLLKQKIK